MVSCPDIAVLIFATLASAGGIVTALALAATLSRP